MSEVESLSATKLALLGRKLWAQEGDLRRAEPIAIVGMGCRFPGGANTPEQLWDLLLEGRDVVGEVPADRWDADAWYDEDAAAPGRMNSRWGGFLDDVKGFDAAYFEISPREAERMDPQQRLALEVSCEAIERAGIPFEALRGAPVGVYFASYHNDYTLLQYADLDGVTARTLTGTLHAVVANRISYLLGLRGPSLAIDSACSSSLVATHLACQALRGRECDVALAGGVSVMATPHVTVALAKGGFMSPTGRCHTFDAGADGFVRAEGCGVLVLKRLSDAIAAGDAVVGVIRGSAVNQDGESTTLSAPNGLAQEELVRSALRNAGLRSAQVSLIEAHGTGTELGDPIETDALAAAFRDRDPSLEPAWLGSLKSNLGHLEAAAGVAGVIKAVLCMRHATIPPHALFNELSRHIDLAGVLRIATEATPWSPAGARIAGVSGFGVGGTNAHILVEEPPAGLNAPGRAIDPPWLLPLSARSEESLRALAARYAARIRTGADPGALCVAAARRRSHRSEWRTAVVAADTDGLLLRLDAIATGTAAVEGSAAMNGVVRTAAANVSAPSVAGPCFVFTGQGSQYPGMAAALRERVPAFAEAFVEATAAILAAGGPDVIAETERAAADSRLDRTEVAQPAIFATQYALVRLLDGWGIRPAAVIGHSIGELAAAVAAGILDLRSAASAVVQRARLMEDAFDSGRMASVRATEAWVEAAIVRSGGTVSIAAVNGPTAVVIAGGAEAVSSAVSAFADDGVESTLLEVRFPFHGPEMAGPAAALEKALGGLRGDETRIPFFSTVTGARIESIDASYLAENVRAPVRFAAAVESALEAGFVDFVEIGSHPALGRGILELGLQRDLPVRTGFSLHRERDHRLTLRTLVAQRYAAGIAVNWVAVFPGPAPAATDLPTYPWKHLPCWLPDAPDLSRPGATAQRPVARGFPGTRISSPALSATVFELDLADPTFTAFADHRVGGEPRLPATAMLELIRQAAVTAGIAGAEVTGLGILRPLSLGGDGRVQTVLSIRDDGRWSAEVFLGGSGQWEKIASAEVGAAVDDALQTVDPVGADDDALAGSGSSGDLVPRDDFYTLLADQGCDFGAGFQLLNAIVADENNAEGGIDTGAEGRTSVVGRVDPARTDAAAQLCIAVLLARGLASGTDAFLPWSVDRYRVPGDGQPVRGKVRLREAAAEGATFDVQLLDAEGGRVAELRGWRLRRTSVGGTAFRRIAWVPEPAGGGTPAVPVAPASLGGATGVTGGSHPGDAGRWLVLGETDDLLTAVVDGLREAGRTVELVDPASRGASEEMEAVAAGRFAGLEGIVVSALPSLPTAGPMPEETPIDLAKRVTGRLLPIARSLASASGVLPRLVVMTRGAQDVAATSPGGVGTGNVQGIGTATEGQNDPAADRVVGRQRGGAPGGGAALGITRALSAENPAVLLSTIDLDTVDPAIADVRSEAASVVAEALTVPAGGDTATEVAFRDGVRLVARDALSGAEIVPPGGTGPVRLVFGSPGTLDGIGLHAATVPEPAPGEVVIRVLAAGMNFRDVLTALGSYPGGNEMGHECCGIVESVGEGVTRFARGDRVMSFWPGSFASHAVAPETFVFHAPAGLDPVAVASVPVAYGTAWYALHELGGIGAESTVLIHSAAGGVGLAAVRLAQAAGARVFATAGSPAKREMLLRLGVAGAFDSRSPSFADAVLDATGGRGVDLVLNSLIGPMIPAGMRSLRSGGLFVELGKRETLSPEQARAFGNDARYVAFDLGDEGRKNPTLLPRIFSRIKELIETGGILPLPAVSFPLGDAGAAFRRMAKAEHVGKLVLLPPALPDRMAGGWTVVTGGSGGVGSATVRWLAGHGAKRIAVWGRSLDPGTFPPISAADGLASGTEEVEIRLMRVDVTERAEVETALAALRTDAPITGIVHAAAVIDDATLVQQDEARVAVVLEPKLGGAWWLHEATLGDPIELFALYSAAGPLIDAKGQANYAAANAAVDELAVYRRRLGLPAVSVRWGPWSGAGMAARLDDAGRERWSRHGLEWWNDTNAGPVFEAMTRDAPANVLAVRLPESRRVSSTSAATPRSGAGLRAEVEKAAAGEREALLETRIQGILAGVLGVATAPAVDVPLRDAGLDSLSAIELRNALSVACGLSLPATVAFDHPTVAAIARFLLRELGISDGADPQPVTVAEAVNDDDSIRREVEALSEEDAERLLLEELGLL